MVEKNGKELVIITAHYPYGLGEAFVEDELRVAEKYFDKIHLFSCDVEKKNAGRFIPANCDVNNVRKKRIELIAFLHAMKKMLTKEAIDEISFAIKKLNKKNLGEICRKIFIYYYLDFLIYSSIKKTVTIDETKVFYSYWMNEGAYALSNIKKRNQNIVCFCRSHSSDCYIDVWYNPFRREILEQINKVYAISCAGQESINNNLVRFTAKADNKVVVSKLGIFVPNKKDCYDTKHNNSFTIVTCSSVIQRKRLDLMVDALKEIEGNYINWVHFGDGPLLEEIKEKVNTDLSSKNNITVSFYGALPKKEILEWYSSNKVDCFVNCADMEGIPVSIMEAMAFGIPVIARNIGGNREIVEDGINGFLIQEKESAKLLAASIIRMIETEDRNYITMRQNAKKTYENNYSAEKNYNQFWGSVLLMTGDNR